MLTCSYLKYSIDFWELIGLYGVMLANRVGFNIFHCSVRVDIIRFDIFHCSVRVDIIRFDIFHCSVRVDIIGRMVWYDLRYTTGLYRAGVWSGLIYYTGAVRVGMVGFEIYHWSIQSWYGWV